MSFRRAYTSMAAPPPRRRLTGKRTVQPQPLRVPAALRAIADEGWSELTALGENVKRKHVHWTQVRTNNPTHRQPATFSRESFWNFLCGVYREVYPEPANDTGSIVLFGMVVKEHHAASALDVLRDEHHHAPVYTSRQHYWRPVAQRALEVHNVKLHAACHDGYASMYFYLRNPTPRKPLLELDAVPFFSPAHPQGGVLQRLLETAAHAERGNAGKRRAGGAGDSSEKRFRAADLFDLTVRTGVRTHAALLERANAAVAQGDTRLAEFCTVHSAEVAPEAEKRLLIAPCAAESAALR